jgi:hypothetical protein
LPPPPTLKLSVVDNSGGNFVITSAAWIVWQHTPSGFGTVGTYSGTSVTVTPPGPGQYLIHADVTALRKAVGDNEVAEFRLPFKGPGGATAQLISWPAIMSETFRLIAEGAAGGLFNPVVVL